MEGVRKALAFVFLGQYSQSLIYFVTTIVIARLLTPEEIGVFSVGAAMLAFANVVRDFGISRYIIQESDLTEQRIRSALALGILTSWSVGLVFILLSVPISDFFERPELATVVTALTIPFFVNPFVQVTRAQLARHLQYGLVMIAEFLGAIVGSIATIALALRGFSTFSLVWGPILGTFTSMAALLLLAKQPFRLLVPSLSEIKRVWAFGSHSFAAALATEGGANAPELIIGKVMGFQEAGLFSRAVGLVRMFNHLVVTAVSRVTFPYFSKCNRDNRSLAEPFLSSLDYMLGLALPFFAMLGLFAREIVLILFGSNWVGSVPIVQVISFGMPFELVAVIASWAIVAKGLVKANLVARITWEAIKVSLVVLAAAFYDLVAIGAAVTVANVFGFLIFRRTLTQAVSVSLSEELKLYARNTALMACTLAPALLYSEFIGPSSDKDLLELTLCALTASAGWFVGAALLRHRLLLELRRLPFFAR